MYIMKYQLFSQDFEKKKIPLLKILCLALCPILIFLKIYFDLFYVYEYIVFMHTRREYQIPLQMVVSYYVIVGNWTQDLWKSSQCS